MIAKVLSSDLLKIRRKGLWLLAFIAPLGIAALQALNYGMRYDYMMDMYADDLWGGLLENIALFVPISAYLGITLLSSLLANIEHATGSWKQLLSLPVSRTAVFASKFTLCAMLLLISGALLAVTTAALGAALRFDMAELPYGELLRLSFFPLIASMPVLALMLWLCVTMKNQALPITLGVVLAIFSIFPIVEWVPISWPMLGYTGPHREWFISAGAGLGFLILMAGLVHFQRKDVA
ncbi:ABC transporter permease [Paenibacillus sp. NEAU-GSW1]|uniref:ABC transporter permease n=1 Tax=Paenibacillus sp. NEAU-GSW1 TaxID=2682486 RepID=UPI0012E24AA2|nr:ABC transporter permease [Paenibacillus sp. NEAU-GSW1]MUT66104.1 ABC transporter permease subunit [Paenibacillus sp. NEAU-GSW1]